MSETTKKMPIWLVLAGVIFCALLLRACTTASQPQSDATPSVTAAPSSVVSAQIPTPWWNSSWKYRQKLLFNNKNQVEDLIDFPVLVHLTDQNFDFSLAEKKLINPLGNDLRFIAQDGKTVLPYEIENWSVASKSASIWVKVPKIHALTNQDYITMYSGNPAVSVGEQKQTVWDKHFISVWHLSDYAPGELFDLAKDSTVFGKDLRRLGERSDVVASSSAVIGNSARFLYGRATPENLSKDIAGRLSATGDMSYFEFGENENFSVSTWFKPEIAVINFDYTQLLGPFPICCGSNNIGWGFRFRTTDLRNLYFSLTNASDGQTVAVDPSLPSMGDQWHYLAAVRRGDSFFLLFDDKVFSTTQAKKPGMFISTIRTTYPYAISPFVLGGDTQDNNYYGYRGFIDETRISRSGRSLSWFQAEYLNGLDQFVNYEEPSLTVLVPDKKLSTTDLNLDITFTNRPSPYNATMSANTLVQVYSATPSATRTPLNFQGIKNGVTTWKGTVKIPKTKLGQYQHFQGSVELIRKDQVAATQTHFTNLSSQYTNQGSNFDFQVDLNTSATVQF